MDLEIISWPLLEKDQRFFRIGQFICLRGATKGSAAIIEFPRFLNNVGTVGPTRVWENVTKEQAKELIKEWENKQARKEDHVPSI